MDIFIELLRYIFQNSFLIITSNLKEICPALIPRNYFKWEYKTIVIKWATSSKKGP